MKRKRLLMFVRVSVAPMVPLLVTASAGCTVVAASNAPAQINRGTLSGANILNSINKMWQGNAFDFRRVENEKKTRTDGAAAGHGQRRMYRCRRQ
jgi:hypothetical protein